MTQRAFKISFFALFIIGMGGCDFFKVNVGRKSFDESTDSDGDGIRDVVEMDMGLNPDVKDSDNDGTPDGDEDYDKDGLSNKNEIKYGYNPKKKDSDGDGKKDCSEDSDKDGVPLCYEVDNKLKPTKDDADKDADKDGYTNEEEYAKKTDPQDELDFPGPDGFTYTDNDKDVDGRTNATSIPATASYCFSGEKVLFSTTNTKPSASDTGFVTCSTTANGMTAELSFGSGDKEYTVYVWRKVDGKVRPSPAQSKLTYDTTGPSGGAISKSASTTTTATLSLTTPTSTDYESIVLRRFTAATCSDKLVTEGTSVTVAAKTTTSISETGLTAGTQYCYKVFWYDDLDNVSSTTLTFTTTEEEVTSCSYADSYGVSNRRYWYKGSTVSYTISCSSGSVSSLSDPQTEWPSYLSASGAILSGTPSASAGAVTYTVRPNNDSDGDVDIITQIIDNPAFQTPSVTSVASLTDNTVATLFTEQINLTSSWDGNGTDVNVLPAPGDIANGSSPATAAFASAETNVPLLQYNATVNSCTAATSPTVCPSTTTFVAGTPSTATGSGKIKWNYDWYDQGSYFVNIKGHINIELGAKYYDASATKTTFTVADPGGEQTLSSGNAAIGHNDFVDSTLSFYYQPQIALSAGASDAGKQVFATIFATRDTVHNQRFGTITIDRSAGTIFSTAKYALDGTDFVTDNTYNAKSSAIVDTSANHWLVFSGNNNSASGTELRINRINSGTNATADFTTVTSGFSANASYDTSIINSIAATPYFSDSATTNNSAASRHGIAFYGYSETGGTKKIYVSKVNTIGTNKATLFDATDYYDAAQPLNSFIPARAVSADANDKSLVRMAYADEGTKYFYVGWRDESTGSATFVRIDATGETPTTHTGTALVSTLDFNNVAGGDIGRPDYSIAAGSALNAGGTAHASYILGVLYTQDDAGNKACFFKAISDNGAALVAKGSATQISGGATTVECRWPHLFYNSATKRFMAIYYKPSDGNTYYNEFWMKDSDNSFTTGTEVVVTDKAAGSNVFLGASYSSADQRIGIIRSDGSTLSFDMYRTGQ